MNVDRYGAVSSISGNFFTGSRVSVAQVPISAADAVRAFGASMRRDLGAMQMTAVDSLTGHSHFLVHGPTIGEVPCRLVYMQTPDGLQLVWDIEVEMLDSFWHAHVDALSGRVIGQVDWVSGFYSLIQMLLTMCCRLVSMILPRVIESLSKILLIHSPRPEDGTMIVGKTTLLPLEITFSPRIILVVCCI